MGSGAACGVGDLAEGVVTRIGLYFALFVVIQIAICVEFYRVMRAVMRVDGRVWYRFAVLSLLAVAEGVTLFGMYRLAR